MKASSDTTSERNPSSESRVAQLEGLLLEVQRQLVEARAQQASLAPIRLKDAAPLIGLKPQTIHAYMSMPEKRSAYMLDALFFKIGRQLFTTRERMQEWSRALSTRREGLMEMERRRVDEIVVNGIGNNNGDE